MVGVRIEQLAIGADASSWADAGFAGDAGGARVGEVALHFTEGEGIRAWRLEGIDGEIDGLPVSPVEVVPGEAEHANGVTRIDHIVVLTPDLERTTRALEVVGTERRRVREVDTDDGPLRQGFFRLGEVILEVIGSPGVATEGPSTLWGVTFVVDDIDASAAYFGERTSPVKDAVQPGRRITTLRHRDLGLSVRTALISPHVRAER